MKVKVQNIQIQMTANEASMLCNVFHSVDWKTFSTDKQVVEGYKSLVDDFIGMIEKTLDY